LEGNWKAHSKVNWGGLGELLGNRLRSFLYGINQKPGKEGWFLGLLGKGDYQEF